jgi:hypothetical protein
MKTSFSVLHEAAAAKPKAMLEVNPRVLRLDRMLVT